MRRSGAAGGNGSGLGVSQVFGFAGQSGGFATIESGQGQGTHGHHVHSDCDDAMVTRRILYVEDDALLRMVTVLALQDAGFDVLEAANGHPGAGGTGHSAVRLRDQRHQHAWRRQWHRGRAHRAGDESGLRDDPAVRLCAVAVAALAAHGAFPCPSRIACTNYWGRWIQKATPERRRRWATFRVWADREPARAHRCGDQATEVW